MDFTNTEKDKNLMRVPLLSSQKCEDCKINGISQIYAYKGVEKCNGCQKKIISRQLMELICEYEEAEFYEIREQKEKENKRKYLMQLTAKI
jgi:hypothetical protein